MSVESSLLHLLVPIEDDEMPKEESSSTSSSMPSHFEDDSVLSFLNGHDAYADVRDRLEELATHDKERYAYSDTPRRHEEPSVPFFIAFGTYMSYVIVVIIGRIRDLCAHIFQRGRFLPRKTGYMSDNRELYAPLLADWHQFLKRRVFSRVQDSFNRPIASNPGSYIDVMERVSYDKKKSMQLLESIDDLDTERQRQMYLNGPYFTQMEDGTVARRCLNLGSYIYLCFSDDWKSTCAKEVKGSLKSQPIATCSTRNEFGTSVLHRELEMEIADFVGKEDAMVYNMGFNTNATTIPALVGRGDLIISDELNHTSIVNGARASGAAIRTFRHNDMEHLEEILRESIIKGRPRTRRPWKKIMVVVEGIYSMEGEYCDLRNVVRICKHYGAYIYMDEAHSIGAMGSTGRGCAEYTGVDPADIDILMGTFTKSFSGMGGYIAASTEIIGHLRRACAHSAYHAPLSPVVCQQCITALKIIRGLDGTNIGKQRLQALRDNSNYFRMRLEELGFQCLGHYDSPIIPVMLYNLTQMPAFSRECLKRGLAVVVVGFPAVPILMSRARFCMSAGHTRADLDRALKELDQIADICSLRYARPLLG